MSRRRNRSSRSAPRRKANRSQAAPVKGPIIDFLKNLIGGLIKPFLPSKGSFRTNRNLTTGTLPGAYQNTLEPRFKIIPGSNGVRVMGCDLVNSVPSEVNADDNFIFSTITCNPCYWTGTRIAQVGAMYMNYRPIRLYFCYIPQVSVSQAGTVVMGTVWNGAAPTDNLQQTLFTSNGGMMTQCYVPCVSEIKLGSNLPQNIFNTNGPLEQGTNPFMFMAALRGAAVVPGYFYVAYEYEFKNALGQAWDYGVQYKTRTSQLPSYKVDNISVVPLSQYGEYGPGTVFGYDKVASMLTYNNRLVSYSVGGPINETTNVAVYYNQQHVNSEVNPIDPSPVPDPVSDQIISILMRGSWVNGSTTVNCTIQGATRISAAYEYHSRGDKWTTAPAHSGTRAYLYSVITYLDNKGSPVTSASSITTRANVRYCIYVEQSQNEEVAYSFDGWYSFLGYVMVKNPTSGGNGVWGTPFTLTTARLVGFDGALNQIFELPPDQAPTMHRFETYAANSQTEVPSVAQLNLHLTNSNSNMVDVKMPDSIDDVMPSTLNMRALALGRLRSPEAVRAIAYMSAND